MSRKTLSILSLSVALSTVPISASAEDFSDLFVFGDSLTDTGNISILTAPHFQPVPFGGLRPTLAYENGRLTNGPVWVEYLADNLGLTAFPSFGGGTNFAIGGARTGAEGSIPGVPSVKDQIAVLQSAVGGNIPNDALYAIWGGGNNILDASLIKQTGDDAGATTSLTQSVADIVASIETLNNGGAKNIVVINAADLGKAPAATRGPVGLDQASTAVSIEFNTLLDQALSSFRNDPTLNLIEINSFEYLLSVLDFPENFGITNVTDPCVDLASVCSNPSEFFFYDGIHPSAIVHETFGQFVTTQVQNATEPIPEPLTILGVGTAVAFGAGFKGKLGKAKIK